MAIITGLLAGLNLKKFLTNKWILISVAILSIGLSCYVGGRLHQWKIGTLRASKAETKEVIRYIKKRDEVREYHRLNKTNVECILSGRASIQHSEGCK